MLARRQYDVTMLEVTLYFRCDEKKPPLPLMVAIVPWTKDPIRMFDFEGIPHVALSIVVFEEKHMALACATLIANALVLPVYDYSEPDTLVPKPLNNPHTS
jgi:hypothetical protein